MINWAEIFATGDKSAVQGKLDKAAKIAFVDIDHTISDSYWRDPMIGVTSWDEYHEAARHDKPIPETLALITAMYDSGWTVVGLTGRPERFRQPTMKWLIDYGVMIDHLIMRGNDDYRPTAEYKLAEAKAYMKASALPEFIVIVLDDREDVVAAFKAERIVAIHIQTSGGRIDEKGKEADDKDGTSIDGASGQGN